MQTRIKFCGMTQLKDVQYAINLHVDALGFVFVEGSSRTLTVEKAGELIKEIPPFIIKVGLFMNADADYTVRGHNGDAVERLGGDVLMTAGLSVALPSKPAATIVHYRRAHAGQGR